MRNQIQGQCKPEFNEIEECFSNLFAEHRSLGASLAIYHEGQPVVNLWGGYADSMGSRVWDESTLSVIFSCTKGLMSILTAMLVERGALRYSDKVSLHWPEFAKSGKGDILVSELISHRAGLAALREPLETPDIVDWEKVTTKLASQAPLWSPGQGHAYHAITHGWLIGEVLKRASGKTPGHLFRELIAEPLMADTWIGLPDKHLARVAEMWVGSSLAELIRTQSESRRAGETDWADEAMTLGGALPRALVGEGVGFNDPEILMAEVPGAGGVSRALDLAAIWSSTVVNTRNIRLISDDVLNTALVPQSWGQQVWDSPPPWATWGMGFQLDSPARTYLTRRSFGHDGAGGQVTFADQEHRVGFAFLTNQMEGLGDSRASEIIEILRKVLT